MVRMSGEIDLTCAAKLSRLEKSLKDPDCVVIDLSSAQYVDTTFLRFLMRLKRHSNKVDRAAVKIVGVDRRMRRIFEITGLSRIFEVEPNL